MDAFPAFFPLRGKTVIIAGEGEGALAKARLFENSPATVQIVAGSQAYVASTYSQAVLVFVAHPDEEFCLKAAAAARQAGVPVNVVDRPTQCDFTTPALIDRGEVVAAIGTGGSAPLLASLLRADIEARIPLGVGQVAGLLRQMQGEIRAALPDLIKRRAFMRRVVNGPVADLAMAGEDARAEAALLAELAQGAALLGRLYAIVVEGPADLLSLRAARVLSEADVLVEGQGSDPAIAILARRDSQRLMASDMDAQALKALLAEGLQVVLIGKEALGRAQGLDVETLPAALS
jgi:precorrin-2 dehydrogenase/sirohydrochlorin ferrochelatase